MTRQEARCRARAECHDRERLFCLDKAKRDSPYEFSARQDYLFDNKLLYDPEPYDEHSLGIHSWVAEERYHSGIASEFRVKEADCAAARQNSERHLIFP